MNVLTNSVVVSFLTMFSAVNFEEGFNIDKVSAIDLKSSSIESSSTAAAGSLILQEGLLLPSSIYTVWFQGQASSEIVWEVFGGSIRSGHGTMQLEFITDSNPFTANNYLSITAYYTDSSGQQRSATVTRYVASGGGGTPIEW